MTKSDWPGLVHKFVLLGSGFQPVSVTKSRDKITWCIRLLPLSRTVKKRRVSERGMGRADKHIGV